MALHNNPVPSLIGGVSQQAAALRHPTQVEELDNFVPSIASGLRKRTGHQYIAKLADAGVDHQFSYVHTINRGVTGIAERYFVVLNNGDLKIYDFRGGQIPCVFPDGKQYLTGYFNMRDNFHCVTVADYTFITKKPLPVLLKPYSGPAAPVQRFYMVIRAGVINTSYYAQLNGTSYAHTTGDATTIKTIVIAQTLAATIQAGPDFDATTNDNVIIVTPKAGSGITAFTCSATDTYGDQATFGFTNKVNRYEDLPRKFIEDVVVEVKGEPQSGASWYVKWVRSASTQDGVWTETIKPQLAFELDDTTMPHQLIRLNDGTFEFRKGVWKHRLVGDDDSNPVPSFVNSGINAVFFHRNRLGFLSDENIIMSGAGDYFNFWAGSARAETDADPVDVSAATNKVTILRHAVPFDKSLLVFADKQQFQFASGDILSGKTAKLEPTTAFEASSLCQPTALGRNVFFPTNRGNYTSIREYYYDGSTVANDAADVTRHCPSYVPTGVFKITAAPTEDMVFALSKNDGERNKVWVYNSAWQGEEKVQSAWHRWVFPTTDLVVSVDVFASTLTFIVQRPDGLYLDMMELEERPYSPTTYTLCLDRWVGYSGGTYDQGQGLTFWTLPFTIQPDEVPVVVLCNKVGEAGQGLEPEVVSGNAVALRGNYSTALSVVGIKYLARARLSEQFARDGKSNAIINARVQLRDISVQFENTGFFEATVTPDGRETNTHQYSGKRLGLAALKIGSEITESGKFKFPIMAAADEVTIELQSDAHTPCVFLTAEWQGNLSMQAQRK